MVIRRLIQSGFEGGIYPINPSHRQVMGFTAHARLADLPEVPDLAILAVPSSQLVGSLEECGQNGVGSAMILSGLPAGPVGEAIQAELSATARRYRLILLGPNGLGYWNPAGRIAATFAPLIEDAASLDLVTDRRVSIVSQSGGVGNSIYEKCHKAKIGVRYVLSLGNEADLHTLEVIEWLLEEGGSTIILLYVEGFRHPDRFAAVAARAADQGVTLVVIKAGRSAPGRRAAVSHTGHMIGADAAYDAVFARYGALRVNDIEEMLAAVKALSGGRDLASRSIAIVSTGGGFAAMLADACVGQGFEIPEFGEALQARLAATIPDYGFAGNPVDLPGGYLLEDRGVSLARIIDDLAAAPNIDAIILCFGLDGPGRIESMRAAIEPSLRRLAKPVLFHSPTAVASDNLEALATLGVRDYSVPACADALSILWRHGEFRRAWASKRPTEQSGRAEATPFPVSWDFETTVARLQAHGIAMPEQSLVGDVGQALRAATRIGYPVALKIHSADLPHKTEVGGVRLGIVDDAGLGETYADLLATVSRKAPEATIEGVIVQKMASRGVEMAIGVVRDEDFGPLIMVSAGGILLEIFKDVVFSPLPLDRMDARAMIGRLKSRAALGAVRGAPPADIAALETLLVAVASFFETSGQGLAEIEFNPVIVLPEGQGVRAVDFLVVPASRSDAPAPNDPGLSPASGPLAS